MQFTEVPKVQNLDPEIFVNEYVKKLRPVVLKDFAKDWPAIQKWTFDFFKKEYGHFEARIHDEKFHQAGDGYMKHSYTMRLAEYLDLIQKAPTKLRFHNFQIMKEAPELGKDFHRPKIKGMHFFKFALMFMGGKGSALNLHYDIDCSHVFLTHFQTSKEVYLFPYQQKDFLYHHPYTVQSHVDVLQPDLEKYPAYEKAQGFKARIEHGETLFIPRMFWHYVYYSDEGYSLAIRATDSPLHSVKGLWNLSRHFLVDNGLNNIMGDTWLKYKENQSIANAQRALQTAD